jgi:Tfp pilus assembly protein PilO
MKKSTERLISLTIAMILLLASLVIYFDFIQSTYGDVQNIRGEIASKQSFLDSQKQTIGQIQSLLSDYKNEADFQTNLSTALPLDPESASALGQLNGLAQANNLNLASVNSTNKSNLNLASKSEASLINPVGVSEFKLRLIGKYEDIRSLIINLESNYRIFDVQQINISPVADPKQDSYNLDLTVDTYYQTN